MGMPTPVAGRATGFTSIPAFSEKALTEKPVFSVVVLAQSRVVNLDQNKPLSYYEQEVRAHRWIP